MAWMIKGRFGRASAGDMYEFLGLSRSRAQLPPEGMAERLIQGVRVYVAPLVPGWGKRRSQSMGVRYWQGLRVYAICGCGRHVAVGRMHQHKCEVHP